MVQGEIDFDRPALVHRNAKDTEIKAAEAINPKVTGLRLDTLKCLGDRPTGMSSSQVVDGVGRYEYSVKPRITELQNMGLVEDSGLRAKNPRGRQEVVWRITEAGLKFLEGIDG